MNMVPGGRGVYFSVFHFIISFDSRFKKFCMSAIGTKAPARKWRLQKNCCVRDKRSFWALLKHVINSGYIIIVFGLLQPQGIIV